MQPSWQKLWQFLVGPIHEFLQFVNICGGPLTNEELACAPGCLLAYLAKLLELALVLANSVAWWRDGSWAWEPRGPKGSKGFSWAPKKTISQSVSVFFGSFDEGRTSELFCLSFATAGCCQVGFATLTTCLASTLAGSSHMFPAFPLVVTVGTGHAAAWLLFPALQSASAWPLVRRMMIQWLHHQWTWGWN